MNQETIDRMVTGCPALDPRDTVNVAFRNYERYIAAPLKSVLGGEWKDEGLYAVSQTAANAITYRDRTIVRLNKEIEDLKKSKTLVFSESDNTPCTAELEVSLQNLAMYFDRRARKNKRRAENLEKSLNTFVNLETIVEIERGAYYFSGKADSYERAAQKLREALSPTPEKWIVEVMLDSDTGTWTRSSNLESKWEFNSKKEALDAIESTLKNIMGEGFRGRYRAVLLKGTNA